MNDQSLFKGVVSAYNAVTKEPIFTGLHNVVTVRAKLWTLSKVSDLINVDGQFNNQNVYIDPVAMSNSNTRKTNVIDVSSLGPIKGFRVGKQLNADYPMEYEDISGFTNTIYETAWFSSEDGYHVSDIPAAQENIHLFYMKNNGAFLRYKLRLYGGANSTGHNGLGVASGQSKDINLIGLCNANGRLFTQFRFPSITFYADTQVDFEYRLYL